MTDKELLGLAAKAAGAEVVGPIEKYIVQPNKEHIGGFIVRNDRSGDSPWNPLTNDGDALRLAVKLQLLVNTDATESQATNGKGADECELHQGSNAYAATRRAIVRAAAEIGRSMP